MLLKQLDIHVAGAVDYYLPQNESRYIYTVPHKVLNVLNLNTKPQNYGNSRR